MDNNRTFLRYYPAVYIARNFTLKDIHFLQAFRKVSIVASDYQGQSRY